MSFALFNIFKKSSYGSHFSNLKSQIGIQDYEARRTASEAEQISIASHGHMIDSLK